MKKTIISSLLLLTGGLGISAQNISGTLTDEENRPLAYANVVLLSLPDSAFVTGNVSDERGNFSVGPVHEGQLVRISSIGYTTVFIPCRGSDLGTIRLNSDTKLLDEVVVEGNLPVTRLEGGALVTSIQNSVLSKAGSAEDVLGKIPGIVKKQDSYEVFGKGAPLIYINGRKVRDFSELDRLNSEDIKQVEVINNPGAQYDASVKAVIRIKTKKQQGEGFGFDLRSSYYQSENTDLIEQLNLNYRHNDLDIFANLRYNHIETVNKLDIEQKITGTKAWTHGQGIDGEFITDRLNMDAGANYTIDENHSLGIRYSLKSLPKENGITRGFNNTSVDNEPYDYINSRAESRTEDNREHAVNVYYNGNVGTWNIDLNADYLQSESLDNETIYEDSKTEEDRTVHSFNEVNNRLGAAKIVFTRPLWGGSLYFGSECTYTNRKDYYLNPENYVPDARSRLKELNASAFAGYNKPLPWGNLALGLRYEHVKFDYYENEIRVPGQSRKYDNFFPTASFGTKLGSAQVQLSYTAKTQRPRYGELSNSTFYQDRYTIKRGDPSLRPTLIHDLTLTGAWKFLQLMMSYENSKDRIVFWGKVLEQDGSRSMVYHKNFENNLSAFKFFLSAAPHIGCWSPVVSAGIIKQWMKTEADGEVIRYNRPLFQGSFNNTFELPKNFLISLDMDLLSKGNYQNIYLSHSSSSVNISLRKSFMNEALSVELRGNDIFKKRGDFASFDIGNYNVYQGSNYDSREFIATVRYKFNTTRSKYKGSGAGQEQKNRM